LLQTYSVAGFYAPHVGDRGSKDIYSYKTGKFLYISCLLPRYEP